MSKWHREKLINCTQDGNLSYGIVQPGQHVNDGVPIIRVNNINNGRLRLDEVMSVTREIEEKYKRTRLLGGEVLLTLVGSTGQSVVVPAVLSGWNIARAIAVIRPKPEIGADWINICLQTVESQQFLDERANTTVQKTLNLGDVRELPIPIPPREIRDKIADIAMALANKIAVNRQINQTLEHIAQAMFKSWFVDFEPVKAKLAAIDAGADQHGATRAAMRALSGKIDVELDALQAAQPDNYLELQTIADLFPAAMQESELGEIPAGWRYGTLSNLCNLNKKNWTAKMLPTHVNYVDLANAKNGEIFEVQSLAAKDVPSRARRVLCTGDTIFGTVRPGNRSFAFIGPNDKQLTGSTGFAVLSAKEETFCELVYLIATSDSNIKRLTRLADGGAYPAVRPDVVTQEPCIIPNEAIVEAFHTTAARIFDQMRANQMQSETLTALRDTLLPKLLSGEINLATVKQRISP